MRRRVTTLLFLITIAAIGTGTTVIKKQHPAAHPIRTHKEINNDHWPTVDYDSPAAQKKLDSDKGKLKKSRYEKSRMMVNPLDESEQTTITHGDADSLSALPLDRSDVVLVGQVTEARSYLSADKTGVYSEFTIETGEVFKDNGKPPITPGGSLQAQRAGGRVRFPPGRTRLYSVSNEQMPLVGKQYLFFLGRDAGDQTLRILTGYELSDGVVAPLDQHDQFRGLKGKQASALLDMIRNLTSASQDY